MEVVFIVTVVVVGYLLLCRRLADMAQPIRLKIAETGERLLASSINDRRKSQVRFYLDNAFSGLIMPIVTLLLPLCCLVAFCEIITKQQHKAMHMGDDEQKLSGFFVISTAAANPIFALLVAIEVILLFPLLFVASGPTAIATTIAALVKAERKLSFVKTAA